MKCQDNVPVPSSQDNISFPVPSNEDNIPVPTKVKGEYRGQTGRTLHSRMAEHIRGLKSKSSHCPLYRHYQETHKEDNQEPEFVMEPSRSTRSNLERLATEAEEIGEGDDDKNITLWNSKSEYGKSKLIRWQSTVSYV